MAISVICPKCNRTLECDDKYAGQEATCPICRTKILLPADEYRDVKDGDSNQDSIPYHIKFSIWTGKWAVYECPRCSTEMTSHIDHAGTKVRCDNCGNRFDAPGSDEKAENDAFVKELFSPQSTTSANQDRVAAQIQALDGVSKLFGRRELKVLPELVWHDENVLKIIQGIYHNRMGILAATDRRLIFVDRGLVFGLSVEDFQYDKVTSIQYETGLVFGKVTIFASGNKAVISQVDKSQARAFAESVREYIHRSGKPAAGTNAAQVTSTPDQLERLERLARLREAGHITEEEFLAQKKQLLS